MNNVKELSFKEVEYLKSIQIERVSPSWAKDTCLVKYKVTFGNHL